MVRHNPRRPKTNAGTQMPALKPLSLMDDPAAKQSPPPHAELFTAPASGQPGFPDRVYLLAAAIFQNNHQQKPASHRLVNYGKQDGSALPKVKEGGTDLAAYELAFNTLKYQELLEDILIDSCFYLAQPMPDEQMSLVAVMLYDFQDRKFLPREHRGEELIQEVLDVEDCLHRFRTKLAASLARSRIKHDLLSIDCLLPETLRRNQKRASSLPLYAWVNSLKSSVDEVMEALKGAGFTRAPSVEELTGRSFCTDPHCGDVLAFPAGLRGDLYATMLPGDHKLIIQEKLCGLGPLAAAHLLSGEGDLLLAGCFSGPSAAHAAGLVAGDDRGDAEGCRVLACVGDRTTRQEEEELQGVLTAMGCKNVELIPQDFQTLAGDDARLQRVRVILLTPQCSVSAVSNPLDFILRENGDRALLPYLSQGSVAQGKLEALVEQQTKDLQHAFSFPQVRSVVYCTVSLFPEENEEVVWRCLEQNRNQPDDQTKLQNFGPSPVLPSFLAPPEGCEEPFFRLEPTAHSNGCFLAVLTREPEPVVEETPQEVLRRANAKGLLDKIGVRQASTRRAKKGAASRTAKETQPPRALHPHPRAPGGNPPRLGQPRTPEPKASGPAPGLDLHGWTNRRPALQAKTPYWQPTKTTAANGATATNANATNATTTANATYATTATTATSATNPSASTREGGDGLRQSAEAVPYKGVAHAPPPTLDGAASIPFLTRMAPPKAPPPLAAVATPTRARPCLVLKSLTLPPVQLPKSKPANHSRAGAGAGASWGGCNPTFSCHSWRPAPSQAGHPPTRGSLHRDLPLPPRPWL